MVDAAARIGYVADANARSLRMGSRRDVGVLISDLANPFYAELATGIEGRLRENGYHMLLVNDGGDAAEESAAVRTFAALRVPGVIVTPVADRVVTELTGHGIQVVQADLTWMSLVQPAVTKIAQDPIEIGRRSADLLIGRLREDTDRPAVSLLVSPTLVVRESTGPLRAASAGVTRTRRTQARAGRLTPARLTPAKSGTCAIAIPGCCRVRAHHSGRAADVTQ